MNRLGEVVGAKKSFKRLFFPSLPDPSTSMCWRVTRKYFNVYLSDVETCPCIPKLHGIFPSDMMVLFRSDTEIFPSDVVVFPSDSNLFPSDTEIFLSDVTRTQKQSVSGSCLVMVKGLVIFSLLSL